MKRVLLLGDSIRLGYEAAVREFLAGEAEVWSPQENCQHSAHHLLNFQAWYLDRPADVIHFNFGLWDCRRVVHGHAQNLVSVGEFCRNLDLALSILEERTHSACIWATITPVIEARHRASFPGSSDPYRVGADVDAYNTAARAVLQRHARVAVNDLHGFVTRNNPGEMISCDGVHYTEPACRLLGREVAECIRSHF